MLSMLADAHEQIAYVDCGNSRGATAFPAVEGTGVAVKFTCNCREYFLHIATNLWDFPHE